MTQPNLDHIHDSLRHLAVPIAALTPDPDNARKHDDKNQRNVYNSLKQFGQRLPIVVQKQGMIIRVGNNRTAQAQKLGWTHIAAVVVDESDVEAMAFALADNRSAEDGATWDMDVLTANMEQIQGMLDGMNLELDMDSIGWSQDEREALLGSFEVGTTDMPSLSGPDEREPIQQITFTLADVQAPTVKAAIERAQQLGLDTDPTGTNPNKNGNAIATICEQWMGMVADDEDDDGTDEHDAESEAASA